MKHQWKDLILSILKKKLVCQLVQNRLFLCGVCSFQSYTSYHLAQSFCINNWKLL